MLLHFASKSQPAVRPSVKVGTVSAETGVVSVRDVCRRSSLQGRPSAAVIPQQVGAGGGRNKPVRARSCVIDLANAPYVVIIPR